MKLINPRWLVAILLCAALTACKIDLYSGLSEAEGNQMLALLQSQDMVAEKRQEKDGTVKLRVERDNFGAAVDLLRQNGFPKRKAISMNDIFPSGQLVTSPLQERAKMVYLKEQQLDSMLTSMDGVITASVSIAQPTDDAGKRAGASSASVFVKYAADVNMANRDADIRRLVTDSVPDILPERISVVLQPATLRYVADKPASSSAVRLLQDHLIPVAIGAAALIALFSFGAAFVIRRFHRKSNI